MNKTSSRVTLHWNLSGSGALQPHVRARLMRRLSSRMSRDGVVLLHVDENRSQHRNREIARERLVEVVREALVERKPRVPTKMSRAAKRKRLEAKRARSAVKALRRDPGRDF